MKKILFYEQNTFFMSQLHNCIAKYLSIVKIFYVRPEIFNNSTIFVKFVSHFSGREFPAYIQIPYFLKGSIHFYSISKIKLF